MKLFFCQISLPNEKKKLISKKLSHDQSNNALGGFIQARNIREEIVASIRPQTSEKHRHLKIVIMSPIQVIRGHSNNT